MFLDNLYTQLQIQSESFSQLSVNKMGLRRNDLEQRWRGNILKLLILAIPVQNFRVCFEGGELKIVAISLLNYFK